MYSEYELRKGTSFIFAVFLYRISTGLNPQ